MQDPLAERNTNQSGGYHELPRELPGTLVGVNEFCELATSHRNLARCDQPRDGLRGLVDLNSGEKFWMSTQQRGPVRAS